MGSALLPANATPAERALADGLATAITIALPIGDLWSPDRCPARLLPWLAWALSVDQWDRSWPDGVKRDVLRNAIRVHRTKGSIGSIKRALAAMGFPSAIVIEGAGSARYRGDEVYDGAISYAPGAGWATYQVILERPISIAQADFIRGALETIAPARSHLTALHFVEAVALYDAKLTYDGAFNYGVA